MPTVSSWVPRLHIRALREVAGEAMGLFCTDQGKNRWYYLSHRGFALSLAKRTAKRRIDNKAQWKKFTSAQISETSQQDTLNLLWKFSFEIKHLCQES